MPRMDVPFHCRPENTLCCAPKSDQALKSEISGKVIRKVSDQGNNNILAVDSDDRLDYWSTIYAKDPNSKGALRGCTDFDEKDLRY